MPWVKQAVKENQDFYSGPNAAHLKLDPFWRSIHLRFTGQLSKSFF